MTDPSELSFATVLLAEYERSRAQECNEYVDLINTAEFQHFLATFGSTALADISDKLFQEHLELQLNFDLEVVARSRGSFPANAEVTLKSFASYMVQKAMYQYISATRALAEIEMKRRAVREENQVLQAEVTRLALVKK
jgi:hypothetical protein